MIRLLLAILAILFTLATVNHAITSSEKAECTEWQADASTYSANWYATSWQVEQCKQFNISL